MRMRFKDTPSERRKFLPSVSVVLSGVAGGGWWRAAHVWRGASASGGWDAVRSYVGLGGEAAGGAECRGSDAGGSVGEGGGSGSEGAGSGWDEEE